MDPEVESILLRWDASRESGRPVPLEELCRDSPDRLEEVRRLVGVLECVDGMLAETNPRDEGTADGRPGGLSLDQEILAGSHCRPIRLHARGGLGEVYVARDTELGRDVAVKTIRQPFGGQPGRRERFMREAEVTARLGHPGVVPIFGVGQTDDGRPCYTMRYVEGETLHAAILRLVRVEAGDRARRQRVLEFRGLVSRLVAVCHTVAFAHSRGVIHRDLKPENVMLGPFQETLVVDWGLAKVRRKPGDSTPATSSEADSAGPTPEDAAAVESDTVDLSGVPAGDGVQLLTQPGSTFGTPAYMSPEQAAGRWDEVGPASDVYSLGAMLYTLLTGRLAFASRSRAVLLDQVRRGEFPPPQKVKNGLSPALAAVCLRAMAVRPADRYASATDLAVDLERWLADEPVSAWREPAALRVGRWLRRRRPLVAGVSALAATTLVALALSTLLLGREQLKTQLALTDARAKHRLARVTLGDMQTSFGLAAAARDAPAEAALWFAEAAITAGVEPDRIAANRIRMRQWLRPAPRPVGQLPYPPPSTPPGTAVPVSSALAFDGRGRFLLSLARSGACTVHDTHEDRPVALPAGCGFATAAAWGGRAGDMLAIGTGAGDVALIRMPGAEVVTRLRHEGPVSALQFDDDGQRLAIGGESSRVWDLARGEYLTPALPHAGRALSIGISPANDRLAVATPDGAVHVYRLGDGQAMLLFKTAQGTLAGVRRSGRGSVPPVFVGGGRSLVTAPTDQELVWLDATTGAPSARAATGLATMHDLTISHDRRVICAAGAGGVRAWDADRAELLRTFEDEGTEAAALTPDGAEVLLASGFAVAETRRIADGRAGGWVLRLQDPPARVAVAPDGNHFAIAQHDGLVRTWRFPGVGSGEAGSKPVAERPGLSASGTVRLAISADGKLVMPLGRGLVSGPSSTAVYDVAAGRAGPELRVQGVLHGGAISPGGRHVVTLSSPQARAATSDLTYPVGSARGWVTVWDWERGTPRDSPVATPSEPVAAAFAPDGRRLLVVCAGGECLWLDPAGGRVLARHESPGTRYAPGWPAGDWVRFSPDARLAVCWVGGRPIVFDGTTGAEYTPKLTPAPFAAPAALLDARFSPNGRYLATAGGDKTVRVWDLATGRHAAAPLAHPDWIFAVVFSADGRFLLTGCRDHAARVWDWRTGTLAGQPMILQGEVQDVAFLDNDRWVLTKASDKHLTTTGGNSVQLWNWRTGRPVTPARLIPSVWGSQVRVSADGRRAVIGGTSGTALHVLDLADWLDPGDPNLALGRLRTIAELYSGQKIVGASTAVGLTTAEYVERWDAYRNGASRSVPASSNP